MGAAPPPSSNENGVFTLSIGSRLEYLSMVHGLIEGLSQYFEIDEETANALQIAVIEAGTNAIQHGNVFAAEKNVTFQFRVDPGLITVCVEDRGKGFDPLKVGDPTNPSNLLDPTGRGLYLMRSLMDEVNFEVRVDHGTTVCLKKARPVHAR